MSWLSSLFGGGGDDQAKIAAAWQQYYAQQEQAKQDALAASQNQAQMDYLNQLRSDQQTQEAKVEAADPTATRNAALASLKSVFTPEYQAADVPQSLIDPYASQVYGEQRASADELINRMAKRGILTPTGQAAAEAELERQAPGVRQQLNKVGQTLLENERSRLGDIEGRAKEAASNLNVGEGFDVTPYSTALSSELGDFTKGLPDAFRAGVPSGNLFDTSSLAAIGGGAQFAGNQPFDPSTTQGIPTTVKAATTGADPFAPKAPVRTASVF